MNKILKMVMMVTMLTLIKVLNAVCTDNTALQVKTPRFAYFRRQSLVDPDYIWAVHYTAQNTGLQVLNPNSWRDFFENISNNPDCDIDPTTCEFRDGNDASYGAITLNGVSISNGIITVDTSVNQDYFWYTLQCSNGVQVVTDGGRSIYNRDYCTSNPVTLVDPNPTDVLLNYGGTSATDYSTGQTKLSFFNDLITGSNPPTAWSRNYCAVLLEGCALYQSDCTAPFTHLEHVWIGDKSDDFMIYAKQNVDTGYTYDICYKCSNVIQNVQSNILKVTQCGLLSTANPQTDVTNQYVSGAPNEQITLNVDSIFANPDSANCPITTCSISDAGSCGGSFSGSSSDISITSDAPWVLSVSKSNPSGYSHSVCLRCSNGADTKDLDNWKISLCGLLSTGNPQTDVTNQYVSGAPNEQITLNVDSIFANPDSANCPITTCSISDAGSCGGSFSGSSSDISITSDAPWVLSVSKSNPSGYSRTVCLRCSNGADTKDLDNWKITQCGLSTGTPQTDVTNQYVSGAPDEQITLNVDSIFANPDPANCPITTCSIFDAGSCGGSFSGSSSDISITSAAPWVLSVSKSNPSGYSHSVCLRCSNGAQTKDLDNWKITQCGLSTGTPQQDVYNQYVSGAPNEQITLDVDSIFANPDSANCRITTCSISDAGSCGGSFSGSSSDISITSSSPWVLSVSKSNPSGYTYSVCLRCSNGAQTKDLDNWKIFSTLLCSPGFTLPHFYVTQTVDSYSDSFGYFRLPMITERCNNIVEYEIGSKFRAGDIPEGLTGKIEKEEGYLKVQSSPNADSVISFYLYLDALNVKQQKIGPFEIIHVCSNSSRPIISPDKSFQQYQKGNVFKFKAFTSQCHERFPMFYHVDQMPVKQSNQDNFFIDYKIPGNYSGIILVQQAQTKYFQPFSLVYSETIKPSQNEEIQDLSITESPLPLNAKIKKIDDFGQMTLEFPYKINTKFEKSHFNSSIVHMFIKPTYQQENSRRLDKPGLAGLEEGLSALDLNFTWSLISFSQDGLLMNFFLNFSSPQDISIGGPLYDKLCLYVLDGPEVQSLILSEKLNSGILCEQIMRQVYVNDISKFLAEIAEATKQAIQLDFWINYLLSQIISGGANYSVLMIRSLVLIFHLPIMSTLFTANVMMVIIRMMPIVMYDMLDNPWDIDVTTFIKFGEYAQENVDRDLTSQVQTLGYGNTNLIQNMGSVFLAFIIYAVQCIITLLMYFYNRYAKTEESQERFKDIYNACFLGDMLVLLYETFLELVFGALCQIYESERPNSKPDSFSFYFSWAMIPLILIVFAWAYSKIYKTDNIADETFMSKYGTFISDLKIKLGCWSAVLFPLIQMIRKFIFIYIPRMINVTLIQIIVNILLTLMMIIYTGYYKPMRYKLENIVQIFNEFIILQCLVSSIFFTDIMPNELLKYSYGWVFVAFLTIFFAVNLGFIFYTTFRSLFQVIKKIYRRMKLFLKEIKMRYEYQRWIEHLPPEQLEQQILLQVTNMLDYNYYVVSKGSTSEDRNLAQRKIMLEKAVLISQLKALRGASGYHFLDKNYDFSKIKEDEKKMVKIQIQKYLNRNVVQENESLSDEGIEFEEEKQANDVEIEEWQTGELKKQDRAEQILDEMHQESLQSNQTEQQIQKTRKRNKKQGAKKKGSKKKNPKKGERPSTEKKLDTIREENEEIEMTFRYANQMKPLTLNRQDDTFEVTSQTVNIPKKVNEPSINPNRPIQSKIDPNLSKIQKSQQDFPIINAQYNKPIFMAKQPVKVTIIQHSDIDYDRLSGLLPDPFNRPLSPDTIERRRQKAAKRLMPGQIDGNQILQEIRKQIEENKSQETKEAELRQKNRLKQYFERNREIDRARQIDERNNYYYSKK